MQCKRPGFDPWVRKFPWKREWQPNPVSLPGELQSMGARRVGHDGETNTIALILHFQLFLEVECFYLLLFSRRPTSGILIQHSLQHFSSIISRFFIQKLYFNYLTIIRVYQIEGQIEFYFSSLLFPFIHYLSMHSVQSFLCFSLDSPLSSGSQ